VTAIPVKDRVWPSALRSPGWAIAQAQSALVTASATDRSRSRRQEEVEMNDAATTTHVEHLEGTELQKSRSYSPAIITMGGKIVWLAGQTALEDLNGRSIEHDFERQTRTCFELIGRTLAQAGGNLNHLVTMTVYLSDGRYGDRFVAIRKEFFPDGKFPCSALLTISGFARPGMMIEIQGVAVIPT
jgi:2-iminobutanoate/2-iminopropanoate deaminase